jgi:hypothetical protein
MGLWLKENGFDGISAQERYRATLCAENRAAIEAWRSGLDDVKRRRFNHPGAVWHGWKRSQKPAAQQKQTEESSPQPGRPASCGKVASSGGRSSAPASEVISHVAQAIRSNWSNDTIKLAVVAIKAYEDFLADGAAPTERPARSDPRDIARGLVS